jgi:hypothetical protein
LLRSVVARILNIQYDNYTVFGRNAADIEFARLDQQQEHESFVRETVDIVEQEADSWEFAAQLNVAAGERLTQINCLLQDVMTAKTVGIAKLRRVFTDEQLAAYEQSLQQPITFDEVNYADGKPAELTHYNKMLREADFMYNKYESMSRSSSVRRATSNHGALKKIYNKSETLYELALEYLEECIGHGATSRQQELLRWLDRDVDFGYERNGVVNHDRRNVTGTAESIPRVKGSKSEHASLDAALPKMNVHKKREQRMLEALLTAAVAIAYEPEKLTDAQIEEQQKLKEKVAARMAKSRSVSKMIQKLNFERD